MLMIDARIATCVPGSRRLRRATEFEWLLRMSVEWEEGHQLSWLPNWAFSTAYAQYQLYVTFCIGV